MDELGGGAAFFDLDNDGDEDLWITGGLNRDVLYENDGKGNFTEIGEKAGLEITDLIITTGVITGDLNNDGYKDVLLLTRKGSANILMQNMGDGTFKDISTSAGIAEYDTYCLSAAMADVNLDGYLDIYVAHYVDKFQLLYNNSNDTVTGFSHECFPNKLYLNNGDRLSISFTEISEPFRVSDEGCALATAFSDFDEDADSDILVANDFGEWVLPNALFENKIGEGGFEDISKASGMNVGIYGMGIAIGDYDMDLDLDYYITNLGENVLMRNEGNGTFTNQTLKTQVPDAYSENGLLSVGWGTSFLDVDNDADLDLYVVNGSVPAAAFIANGPENANRLFLNNGRGNYTKVAGFGAESPERGRGLATADIDQDGDLDFVVINETGHFTDDPIQPVQLFRNDLSSKNNWLKVRLEGIQQNNDGLGSRIYLVANGKKYLQEANGGYGTHASQHSSIIHFGLGQARFVDSLFVIWPGGRKQIHIGIAPNQLITIREGDLFIDQAFFANISPILRVVPNPFSQNVQLAYLLPVDSSIEIEIFDRMGRRIYHHLLGNQLAGKGTLNWDAPMAGTYFVCLRTNSSFVYETIIAK